MFLMFLMTRVGAARVTVLMFVTMGVSMGVGMAVTWTMGVGMAVTVVMITS